MLEELEKMLEDDKPQAKFESPGIVSDFDLSMISLVENSDDMTRIGTCTTAAAEPQTNLTMESLQAAIDLIKEPVRPVSMGLTPTKEYDEAMNPWANWGIPSMVAKVSQADHDHSLTGIDVSIDGSYNAYGGAYNQNVSVNHEDLVTLNTTGPSGHYITASNPVPPDTIRVQGEHGSVDVGFDGTVKIVGDINNNEAARSFWEAIGYHAPENYDAIAALEEKLERRDAEIDMLKEELKEASALNSFLESLAEEQQDQIEDLLEQQKAPEKTPLDRISASRMMLYLKNSLAKIADEYVFEPNDTSTRIQIINRIENFLNDTKERKGIKDFSVVCDESNNSVDVVDAGQLNIDIAVKLNMEDAEFIYIPVKVTTLSAPTNPVDVTPKISPEAIGPIESLPYTASDVMKNMEHIREDIIKQMAIPSETMKAMQKVELAKAQLATSPPNIIVDGEEAERILQEINKCRNDAAFDDAMGLVD